MGEVDFVPSLDLAPGEPACSPPSPLKIAFYYAYPRPDWDWNGQDLEAGLGGTETALIYVARALSREHSVTVFNWTSREGTCDGVRYLHQRRFDPREEWDVLIALRGPVPGLARIRARVKVYWCIEESDVLVGDWGAVVPHVRALFTISPFHTATLCESYPFPPDKIQETFLGVWGPDYEEAVPPERKIPGKLLYCSVPVLGLSHMLSHPRRSAPRHPHRHR